TLATPMLPRTMLPRTMERPPEMAQNTDLTALLARAEALPADGEVVTQALLRKVTLPPRGGKNPGVLGLITLDNGLDHTRPNTFGPKSMLGLNAAIDAALADPEITADRRDRQAVHPGRRSRPDHDRGVRLRRGAG
ncbi:MAG: hypothetical protein V9F00_12390, partial [Nocardioides sp.]